MWKLMGDSAGGGTEWCFPVEIVLLKKLEEEREKNARTHCSVRGSCQSILKYFLLMRI